MNYCVTMLVKESTNKTLCSIEDIGKNSEIKEFVDINVQEKRINVRIN